MHIIQWESLALKSSYRGRSITARSSEQVQSSAADLRFVGLGSRVSGLGFRLVGLGSRS